jgi:hypothetical protein
MQAKKRGMKVTGHMPFTVELTKAAGLGMDGSEHLYYIFKACSSKEDSITDLIRQQEHTAHPIGLFAALPSLYNTYDSVKAKRLFKYLAEKDFTITPTLFITKTLAEIKETDHNINAIDRINVVMANGKLYTSDDLNTLLASVKDQR